MVILRTVSLGYFLFDTACLLRESLFVNGILTNSEVWYGLTKSQVQDFEAVDRLLLRRVLGTPISTPGEALYLELGLIPIQFILKGRRVMFLHYMLQLDTSEMLSQFFYAQWNNPGKNDWVESVKDDIVELGLPTSLLELQSLSHDQCKSLVKTRCTATAFSNLMNQKATHSKMSPLCYDDLKIQPYFFDGIMHSGDVKLLFSYRTRMVKVRCNYKNMHSSHYCPLCESEEDTQEHLLACSAIHLQLPEVTYSDIFGNDTQKMNLTLQALKSAFERREELLKEEAEQ